MSDMTMTSKNLLVELFVEELPPKALKKLGDAFATSVQDGLHSRDYLNETSVATVFASPRRLAVHITDVLAVSRDKRMKTKLMPVSVGLDAQGNPTPALSKRIRSMYHEEVDVADIFSKHVTREMDGKTEALFRDVMAAGLPIVRGLLEAVESAIEGLPIPKRMSYQLEKNCELPGWTSVSFVRPVHGLVAVHGSDVVPIWALGLEAGNTTHGHRFESTVDPVVLKDADSYAATLLKDGAVIASFAERKAEIAKQLAAAAAKVGGGVTAIDDDALLDEVTALVERPNVLVCEFEKEFLDVPQECLILTMKANQKYFPLLDAAGKLSNQFLVVSNITPDDASAVIQGNERVVRPRLADAKFFFDQDRKKTLASRVEGLGKVVYHNKLGSQGERVERVRAIAKAIGQQLGGDALAEKADQAAQLAKTDLVTDMVGEFPELQGTMGRYYALNDGLSADVADAIEDHYKPRFAGDSLPRNDVGVVVALADKLETLVGMFGIGNQPTGDKDPFALRRHALGIVRMVVERKLPLKLIDLIHGAYKTFPKGVLKPMYPMDGLLEIFCQERLIRLLEGEGYEPGHIHAVLGVQGTHHWSALHQRLAAVRTFAALPEAPALAAANKRIGNILKKTEGVDAHVSEVLLIEPAEIALHTAMKNAVPKADAQFESGDYTASLQTLAALRAPVDAFFDGVMVNAEQMDLRLNRLGLLATLHTAMNRVADLSKLAA